jgi:hypothetical protein
MYGPFTALQSGATIRTSALRTRGHIRRTASVDFIGTRELLGKAASLALKVIPPIPENHTPARRRARASDVDVIAIMEKPELNGMSEQVALPVQCLKEP